MKTSIALAALVLCALGCDSPTATTAAVSRPLLEAQGNARGNAARPVLQISVSDLTTGQPVARQQTVTAGDAFQVTVSTGGTDCAGQLVVTALGASGAPPSVLVQVLPYIVGPSVGSNSATGGTLTAGVLPNGTNDWKISTSCNGADTNQFAFSRFEFFAQGP